jgi:7-carboxy-7-deazaguanine synthase
VNAGGPAAPRRLILAEQFGPTVQGEGPSAGQLAVFVRLSRCNLSCTWCDTPYTWDWQHYDPRQESRQVPVGEVISWVLSIPAPLLVITGGEPLIQQPAVTALAAGARPAGRRVEIETNGTIAPAPALTSVVDQFNVSAKLANSGQRASHRINGEVLAAFAATGKAVFKFVAAGVADLDEISALVPQLGGLPVWVMPEGSTEEAVLRGLRALAGPVIARGWNLSCRLHVLAWGDQRGR